MEFDFKEKYKRGALADALSRLPTYCSAIEDLDLDIPGYTVEPGRMLTVVAAVDSSSGTELDTEYDEAAPPVLSTEPVEATPISIEDLRMAQDEDVLCKKNAVGNRKGQSSLFAEEERGLVVRIDPP